MGGPRASSRAAGLRVPSHSSVWSVHLHPKYGSPSAWHQSTTHFITDKICAEVFIKFSECETPKHLCKKNLGQEKSII